MYTFHLHPVHTTRHIATLSTHFECSRLRFLRRHVVNRLPVDVSQHIQLARLAGLGLLQGCDADGCKAAFTSAASALLGVPVASLIAALGNGVSLGVIPEVYIFPRSWFKLPDMQQLILVLKTELYFRGDDVETVFGPTTVSLPNEVTDLMERRKMDLLQLTVRPLAMDDADRPPLYTFENFLRVFRNSLAGIITTNECLLISVTQYCLYAECKSASAVTIAPLRDHGEHVAQDNSQVVGTACSKFKTTNESKQVAMQIRAREERAHLDDSYCEIAPNSQFFLLGPTPSALNQHQQGTASNGNTGASVQFCVPSEIQQQSHFEDHPQVKSGQMGQVKWNPALASQENASTPNRQSAKNITATLSKNKSSEGLLESPHNQKGHSDATSCDTSFVDAAGKLKPPEKHVWSQEEVDALSIGMHELGPRYRAILELYGKRGSRSTVLATRNPTQLKDKARNIRLRLERSGQDLGPYVHAVKHLNLTSPNSHRGPDAHHLKRDFVDLS